MGFKEGLDRSLREWGKDQIIKHIWKWQARLIMRCSWLANNKKKTQASIERNFSMCLMEGLNPHLNSYFYGEEKDGANKGKNPGV